MRGQSQPGRGVSTAQEAEEDAEWDGDEVPDAPQEHDESAEERSKDGKAEEEEVAAMESVHALERRMRERAVRAQLSNSVKVFKRVCWM